MCVSCVCCAPLCCVWWVVVGAVNKQQNNTQNNNKKTQNKNQIGAFENELADLPDDAARDAYCKDAGAPSALPKIITTGFRAIHLIYFFTAGHGEVKCWQIRKASKAPQAAGTIHTDFERGFICAEVMKFDELKELGTEAAVKAAGKYRQEGKGYVVGDSDIIYFKFNVTSSKK